MSPIPPALSAAYAERVLLTAPELCRLLPMDTKTLNGHIRLGHIEYVKAGIGSVCPRKGFTLGAVLKFLQDQSFRAVPWSGPSKGRFVRANPSGAGDGFLALLAREAEEQQQRKLAGTGPSRDRLTRSPEPRPGSRRASARTKAPA